MSPEYKCPYKNTCPLEVGTDTCFCRLKYEYWIEKDKKINEHYLLPVH
jgi:hypothetical protein